MDNKEYLICDYDLRDWQNYMYTGHDRDKICTPPLKTHYYGIQRTNRSTNSSVADDADSID